MKATITSLDKSQFHIIGVEGLKDEIFINLCRSIHEVTRQVSPELQLIVVPFLIESVASRPLTPGEIKGFKDSIKEIAKDADPQPTDSLSNQYH